MYLIKQIFRTYRSLVALVVCCVLIVLCMSIAKTYAICYNKLPKPITKITYKVYIIDDHQVDLVNGSDTIRLYLENSYNLADESIILIDK